MIRDLVRKIKRLMRFNRILQVKMVGCAVLLIAVGVQGGMLKNQDGILAKVNAERDLVLEISAMERKLRTKNLKLLKPESQIIAIKNILEGTSLKDEVYRAIIDGEVYSAGDMIGDYEIMNISMRTILLQNNEIFDIKELRFPENSNELIQL